MTSPRVRAGARADAAAIGQVHVASWRAAYRTILPAGYLASLSAEERTRMWDSVLESRESVVLVALHDREIVGVSCTGPARDADLGGRRCGEVFALYVRPDRWGCGDGHRLCAATIEQARRRGDLEVALWVLEANDRARRFYEARGFVPDGKTRVDSVTPDIALSELRYRLALD